jgi:uncharacterized integral membrane protein (TIGR00697 family)
MKLQPTFSLNTKFIIPLAMLFVVINLAADAVAFRFYHLGNFVISASGIIYPLTFCISDSIAEVYGYSVARKVIWFGLICELIFAIMVDVLIQLPLPSVGSNGEAFLVTLGPVLRFVLSCIIGNIVGIFLNIYCISKWKVILQGRIFWVRSIFATCLGEFSMTFICVFLAFSGYNDIKTNLKVALTTYMLLVIYSIILVWPTWLLTVILKRKEGVDVYDTSINFNPFSLK